MNGSGPTPSFAALLAEAERRGLDVEPLGWRSAVRLTGCGRTEWLMGTFTSRTSHLATLLAGDKAACKAQLVRAGLPVADGALCRLMEDALATFERLNRPVTVKPNLGAQGVGVRTRLASIQQVERACRPIYERGGAAIVEAHHEGRDLRVLTVGGRAVAAAERFPAGVRGDGSARVSDLLARLNADPRRRAGHEGVLSQISVDAELRERLTDQGLTLEHVPEAGRWIALSHVANLSRGGAARDVTDEVGEVILRAAEAAACTVGLDVAGVDFIVDDVSRPIDFVVLEVNASPGLRMHVAPSERRARNVAKPILDYLFP